MIDFLNNSGITNTLQSRIELLFGILIPKRQFANLVFLLPSIRYLHNSI